MPLSEFLRMARGKLEASQQKPPPTDLSSCPEDGFVELVWENGQLMMQGQSNRAKKNPSSNSIASQMPAIRDKYIGNASSSKFGKFEAVLEDAVPSVPTGDISLNQDDEIAPWLNYPMDDGSRQDFFSELLPEFSGVTGNDPSTRNSFGSTDKSQMVRHSHNIPVHDSVNTDIRNASKVCSSSTGFLTPYLSHQGQIPILSLGSGVSNAVMNSTSHNQNISFGDSVQGHPPASGYVSMKMQKQSEESSSNGSRLLNFSHFSRPATLFRPNLQPTDELTASYSSGVEKRVNEKVPAANSRISIKSALIEPSSSPRKENGSNNQPNLVCSKVDPRPLIVKPLEDTYPAEQSNALCQEDSIKNDNYKCQEIGASTIKGSTHGEKSVEPVVAASSVCSGNSAERNSNYLTHNSKRKHRDNDESESRSEDIEEESVDIKNPTTGRGGSGSKRSRAAEVHNLSERRRRDRINEKMRALQELIPNCNKADKASMLDEAIEYLKTLQLQVQMMSMGAGLCMPPMMFPTAFQHMHAPHMPHFAPMCTGMGLGMGFGMGMLDMNSRPPRYPIFPVPQMQGAHFPSPPIPGSSTFQGLGGSNLQFFGHPSQGHPMPVPRAPLVPMTRQAPISSTVGLDPSRTETHAEALRTSPVLNHDVGLQDKNSHLSQNAHASSSLNQTSAQLPTTKEPADQSTSLPKDGPVQDAHGDSTANLTNADGVSRKEGSD